MEELIEGLHYYFSEEGYIVLTERYHRERGYCCGNGCRHCPYGYERVPGAWKDRLCPPPSDSSPQS